MMWGGGSYAPSPGGCKSLDGGTVLLLSTAINDSIGIDKSLWMRWKSLPQIQKAIDLNRMKR